MLFQQLLEGPMEVLLCERVNDPSSQPLWSPQLSHNDSLWAFWYPSWSNSLWQRWSCGLVHCPDRNATDVIWRMLASSNGISSWILLKLNIVTLTVWPINSGVLTSLLLPHLSSSLTDSLPSLNLLCHSKTDARFMQDGRKAVWSIPYVSVAFFPSLKLNFIAYHSPQVSSHPDCIFEIDQLWQSGFSRVYSNCCCSCSFDSEIIKICQSSHKMYSNNIVNFQESTTILNAGSKKVWKLIEGTTYLGGSSSNQAIPFCISVYPLKYEKSCPCLILLLLYYQKKFFF